MKNFQTLFFIFLLSAAICFLPESAAAKDEWLQVRSKNFNLIGNASEKDIRKVATKLEQFRETFRLIFNQSNLNAAIPTNVVVFKNSAAYKPFKPVRADGKTDTFIAGYFQPGEDINYITISTERDDAETYGTIFHEYVHFIINTNFGKSEVPPWFNEGLAEYYQTFAIEEDQKVKLGLPQNDHLLLLQQNKLIPLDTLFKISNYALHQNANHSRSIFYAESWALIHYLVQGGKTAGLGKFLTLVMKNVPPEKAFQEAFQMSYAQMEKELKKYVDQNTYKYSLITFEKKLTFDNEMQVAPLSEADTNAYLGDLLYHTNRADDAVAYLQKAVALKPDSSMANTTFGMVKLRQRKFDEAKDFLSKAISEDQKNHLAFYQYAYLLSREGRDEFGFVSSFPADKTAKMRELLKKAIAVNPGFTESYELLAFVNLVNNEQLDEAVGYLQKAAKYQPGNQRYALRMAEIYLRQDKFAEALAIADKIAKTADEPEIKSQAENLGQQLRKRQEMLAERKQYENSSASGGTNKNGGSGSQPLLIRRTNQKTVSPEEAAKAEEESQMRSLNQAIKKAEADEKQVVGRIQKIDCAGGKIAYTIKTADGETFTLSSKDFQGLAITVFVSDTADAQIGCGIKIPDLNSILTFKTATGAKSSVRGELVAIDFVPNNFRFMDVSDVADETEENYSEETTLSPPPQPTKTGDLDAMRRTAMMQAIKNAMRQPQEGEKREIGLIEKLECGNKGTFFYLKTGAQTFKLSAATPQSVSIRGFTPEIEQLQLGCTMKNVDIPVVFTYKEKPDPKAKSNGELIALEFVPKSFVLEK
jgi:tetratricopeptide (TPR) repeat protein